MGYGETRAEKRRIQNPWQDAATPVAWSCPIKAAARIGKGDRAWAAGINQSRRFARREVVTRAEARRKVGCGEHGACRRAAHRNERNRIGIGRSIASQQAGVQRTRCTR